MAHAPRRTGAEVAASLIGLRVGAASLGIALLLTLAWAQTELLGLELVALFLAPAAWPARSRWITGSL